MEDGKFRVLASLSHRETRGHPQSGCQNRSSVLLKLSFLLTGLSHLFLPIPPTSAEATWQDVTVASINSNVMTVPPLLAGVGGHLVQNEVMMRPPYQCVRKG